MGLRLSARDTRAAAAPNPNRVIAGTSAPTASAGLISAAMGELFLLGGVELPT